MNNVEFKVGDVVHFQTYGWYKPKERKVTKVVVGSVCSPEHDERVFYHLGTTNITTGISIVESKLFREPTE